MAISILPIRRNLKFNLNPAKALTWHRDGLNVSQFMNTMSLFFPVGERFFIDSVRNYRDQITDPELKKAVTAFIGQEAMHGREHEEYNDFVARAGIPLHAQEAFVARLLKAVQDYSPQSFQLAATVALEHLTAILGGGLLDLPEIMEGADEGYKAIWNWHALEETEHKAVAFDVWTAVMGKGVGAYGLRCFGLGLATVVFWGLVIPVFLEVLREQGKLTDWKGWQKFFHYTFGDIGMLRKQIGNYLDYFRPGFHPWDHDNRELLLQIDSFLAEQEAAASA